MSKTNREEPQPVDVLGRPLRCYVCSYDHFWQRRAQLSTAIASLFDLEWTSPSATCCVCGQCGHIHWFLPQQ